MSPKIVGLLARRKDLVEIAPEPFHYFRDPAKGSRLFASFEPKERGRRQSRSPREDGKRLLSTRTAKKRGKLPVEHTRHSSVLGQNLFRMRNIFRIRNETCNGFMEAMNVARFLSSLTERVMSRFAARLIGAATVFLGLALAASGDTQPKPSDSAALALLAPALDDFQHWTEAYIAHGQTTSGVAEVGVRLAKQRRVAMRELIAVDPRAALEAAIPVSVRAQLPALVTAELEAPISGVGDLSVVSVDSGHGEADETRRSVSIGDHTYRAYVYGRRLNQPTKFGIPLQGIEVDGVIALDERIPEAAVPAGAQTQKHTAALSPKSESLPARAGGEQSMTSFDSPEQRRRAEAAEMIVGPYSTAEADGSEQPTSTDNPFAWSIGEKKVLYLRVDFSDLPGEPRGYDTTYTADYIRNVADTQVAPFFKRSSYGRATQVNTVADRLYRMPQTAAFYATNDAFEQLHTDAQKAAAADFNVGTYDRIVVVFSNLGSLPGSKMDDFGGLGDVGGSKVWLNGCLSLGFLAHELGHTYGLGHMNLWGVADGNPISPAGAPSKEGDPFDWMGGGIYTSDDYNVSFKRQIGWVPDSQIQTVTASGTYRVNRFDSDAASGIFALKIAKDYGQNYWVSYRTAVNNAAAQNGAYVIWTIDGQRDGYLLDMTTPGSNSLDAPLQTGATFADTARGVSITVAGRGGSAPNEYLDVRVTLSKGPLPVDSEAPQVVSGTFNPTMVDVSTTARTAMLTLRLTDPLSGFSSGSVVLSSPSKLNRLSVSFDANTRVSGDAKDGAYQCPVTIPRSAEAGVWTVSSLSLTDRVGNTIAYSAYAGGRPIPDVIGSLTVQSSTQDVTGPGLMALTFAPDTVDVSSGQGVLTATVRVTDDNVGFTVGSLTLLSPQGQSSPVAVQSSNRISGNATDGTYQVRLPFSNSLASGVWRLSQVSLLDANSNRTEYAANAGSSQLAFPAGTATTFTVVGGATDVSPPQLLSLVFPGDIIAAAAGNTTVAITAHLVDVGSGFHDATLMLRAPDGAFMSVAMGSAQRISGTGADGVYQAQLQIPNGKPPGTWNISWLNVRDALGNAALYQPTADSRSLLFPAGTPTSFTISGSHPAAQQQAGIANISTRVKVGTGADVLIGGFIVTGTAPKKVIVRAIGPSLSSAGLSGALQDPTLELHDATGAIIAQNDNWMTTQINGAIDSDQAAEIAASGVGPTDLRESAIIVTLQPGSYTAVVGGKDTASGLGLIEVYDLAPSSDSQLANISTRAGVGAGGEVMIGGFIVTGEISTNVVVRAIGPSLAQAGITGVLADPALSLVDGNGAVVAQNDNWRTNQETVIAATGVAPQSDAESAIYASLPAGGYTAIVSGTGGTTGTGLVEVYSIR